MHKVKLLILLSVFARICQAQTVQTYYYSDERMEKEVSAEKGKYAEIITTYADGTSMTEKKDLKKNTTISARKGNEPVGKWTTETGKGPEILDYDFTVVYSKEKCPENGVTTTYFEDNELTAYKAPVLEDNLPYVKHLQKNLRYPARPRRMGIQGRVMLSFTITKDGKIENVIVNDPVDIELDKEAVRVIRKLKIQSPATVDGKPIDLCVTLPVGFKLA